MGHTMGRLRRALASVRRSWTARAGRRRHTLDITEAELITWTSQTGTTYAVGRARVVSL